MIKKILVLIFFVCFLIFIFRCDDYQTKIELKIRNLTAQYIDENIVCPLKQELFNISEIKDIVSFSHSLGADLYIKTSNSVNNKIENKLSSFVFDKKEIDGYKINQNYNLKYNYFFIIYDDDYFELKTKADILHSKLLKTRAFKDIKVYGEIQIVNNIYFKYENLINHNLTIEDIKKIINKHNPKINFQNSDLKTQTNGAIQSIEDLSNIEISYKDANFSKKIGDVFVIKKDIKILDDGRVYYSNKPAIVFALSKKNIFLNFIKINSLKKEFNAIFEPIRKRKKLEVFIDENNIFKTIEFCNNLRGDNLYFISLNLPNNDKFDQNNINRIIIYSKKRDFLKLKNYLKENQIFFLEKSKTYYLNEKTLNALKDKINNFNDFVNLGTSSSLKPNYVFNFQNLIKFNLDKNDLMNSILSFKEGLILDFYRTKGEDIEIVLKNIEKSNFIYSKKFQNLFDINFFLKTDLQESFDIVARKNFDYFAIIKTKNPSILEGFNSAIFSLYNLLINF